MAFLKWGSIIYVHTPLGVMSRFPHWKWLNKYDSLDNYIDWVWKGLALHLVLEGRLFCNVLGLRLELTHSHMRLIWAAFGPS